MLAAILGLAAAFGVMAIEQHADFVPAATGSLQGDSEVEEWLHPCRRAKLFSSQQTLKSVPQKASPMMKRFYVFRESLVPLLDRVNRLAVSIKSGLQNDVAHLKRLYQVPSDIAIKGKSPEFAVALWCVCADRVGATWVKNVELRESILHLSRAYARAEARVKHQKNARLTANSCKSLINNRFSTMISLH